MRRQGVGSGKEASALDEAGRLAEHTERFEAVLGCGGHHELDHGLVRVAARHDLARDTAPTEAKPEISSVFGTYPDQKCKHGHSLLGRHEGVDVEHCVVREPVSAAWPGARVANGAGPTHLARVERRGRSSRSF